ncbi:Gfo/Idh/MocA family protein [Clostridium folliculivorans]|uniref:Oxidoreductase n=1 Tax=Clostridium folliculivorans TaxID=2886038 RepID=A0A9W5Y4Q9_9CLOT|nr:Gfo/Idh/MocA family oxidoreductase [Clostridium folliculivorans]GKU26636.1 oxidoreductase [Clostridium folliculivorans]GKU28932.1 oxidoreductase [Clostridium folliculivorans]
MIKLGIIGCSSIVSRAIITPAKEVKGLRVYGIASRNPENARRYAKEYGIEKAFESYEELLDCEAINCVYIALPNDLHKEWIIKAIKAGKHILVEKPICLSKAEFDEILSEISKKNIKLLEGVMIKHHPWQAAIKEMITSEKYGKLEIINTYACIVPKGNNVNSYRNFPERGGGAFYDLSCYWLQFLQEVKGLNPIYYKGSSSFNGPNGIDSTFSTRMRYENDFETGFIASFELPYKVEHHLGFEKARVVVKDFFRACLGNFKINVLIEEKATGNKERLQFDAANYYTNQLEFLVDVVEGRKESIPIHESYERIKLMEDIYNSAKSSIKNYEGSEVYNG